jgi:hypothetical protein
MSIRFTKKVRLILEHINNYEFITNRQCALIYFKGAKQPYIQAQTKMKLLYDNDIVKRTEYKLNKEYVYSINEEHVSDHRMYLMNLYAYLYNKFDIMYFKTEESWQCKKRNDAHIIIKKDNGDMVGILCEIDLYHKTGQEKLDIMYDSGEIHQWYKVNYGAEDYYPSILIVNSSGKTNIKTDKYEVVAVDFDFNGLDKLL